jgi:hypothetical protein
MRLGRVSKWLNSMKDMMMMIMMIMMMTLHRVIMQDLMFSQQYC